MGLKCRANGGGGVRNVFFKFSVRNREWKTTWERHKRLWVVHIKSKQRGEGVLTGFMLLGFGPLVCQFIQHY